MSSHTYYQAINSDAKLTTIVNNYGPDGLAQHSTDQPDEPNPWFRMNYTGQHRLRDRLCDARVDSDAICVGSQALVGDTEKESASDEGKILFNGPLPASPPLLPSFYYSGR